MLDREKTVGDYLGDSNPYDCMFISRRITKKQRDIYHRLLHYTIRQFYCEYYLLLEQLDIKNSAEKQLTILIAFSFGSTVFFMDNFKVKIFLILLSSSIFCWLLISFYYKSNRIRVYEFIIHELEDIDSTL